MEPKDDLHDLHLGKREPVFFAYEVSMTFYDLFVLHAECGSWWHGTLKSLALFCYKGVRNKLQALICGVYPVSNFISFISFISHRIVFCHFRYPAGIL